MDSNGSRLTTNRWLEAVWEPSAKIHALPGGLEMLDVSGDGEAKLISADLGIGTIESPRIRVFKVGERISEHAMIEPPCGLFGFYTENGEPRSAALAVGAGSNIFIYKNMRPHFKYCLPHSDAHPKEREIWHKAGLEEDPNVPTLRDDLALLTKELGASFMSPRTLKFLALDESLRLEFAQQYRRLPLVRTNAVTMIGGVRKDTMSDESAHVVASSFLIVGAESGELFVLDPRSFSLIERQHVGWIPVAMTSTGMWSGDGQIFVIGRDGNIGIAKKGLGKLRSWEKLSSPGVAVAAMNNATSIGITAAAIAVLTMNASLVALSNRGIKLWRIRLAGIGLDLTSIPMPAAAIGTATGLSLLAVSCPKSCGVVIYDSRNYVDSIITMEPVAAIKYGRMGQEDRAMAMITIGGGLSVKILKRTANFIASRRPAPVNCFNGGASRSRQQNFPTNNRFVVPKKTRLFVEQTLRERSEAKIINSTFQRAFTRLRLEIGRKRMRQIRDESSNEDSRSNPIGIEARVIGLGPLYQIHASLTNVSDDPSDSGLFLVFRNDDRSIAIKPRIVHLPLLPGGIPIPACVEATGSHDAAAGRVRILLCKKNPTRIVTTAMIVLPIAEEDIEV